MGNTGNTFDADGTSSTGSTPNKKPIQRHAKTLQAKSKGHRVLATDPEHNVYTVTSGGSGKQYTVIMFDNKEGNCNCDWGTKRPETVSENRGAVGCSHVLAVLAYMAQAHGGQVSAWSTPEQAAKQHRQQVNVGDGLHVTTRRATGRKRVQSDFLWLFR